MFELLSANYFSTEFNVAGLIKVLGCSGDPEVLDGGSRRWGGWASGLQRKRSSSFSRAQICRPDVESARQASVGGVRNSFFRRQ